MDADSLNAALAMLRCGHDDDNSDTSSDMDISVQVAEDNAVYETTSNDVVIQATEVYKTAFHDCTMMLDDFVTAVVETLDVLDVADATITINSLFSDLSTFISSTQNATKVMLEVEDLLEEKDIQDTHLTHNLEMLAEWCHDAISVLCYIYIDMDMILLDVDEAILADVVEGVKTSTADLIFKFSHVPAPYLLDPIVSGLLSNHGDQWSYGEAVNVLSYTVNNVLKG